MRRLEATFSTFAAGLLIGAMAIRFTGDTLALTWLLESELLLILGLLQREKYFRFLGYIGLGLSLGVLLVFDGGAGTFALFATVSGPLENPSPCGFLSTTYAPHLVPGCGRKNVLAFF